jgi:hypothetical protein
MFVKRLKTIGGLSSLTRYVNLLAGVGRYVPTTNSTAIVLNLEASPYMQVWNWFNGTNTGFNGRYANPATLPTGAAYGAVFKPQGDAIVVGHFNTPRVSAYPWSSGFGTKYADPATLPAGTGQKVKIGRAHV